MKLSQWAKKLGISYKTAWRMYRKGQIPNAVKLPTGSIIVLLALNNVKGWLIRAKNLLERSSLREFNLNLPKKQLLKVLIKRHLERLKGCKSAPLDILKGNPYYKEFLEDILNPRQDLTLS